MVVRGDEWTRAFAAKQGAQNSNIQIRIGVWKVLGSARGCNWLCCLASLSLNLGELKFFPHKSGEFNDFSLSLHSSMSLHHSPLTEVLFVITSISLMRRARVGDKSFFCKRYGGRFRILSCFSLRERLCSRSHGTRGANPIFFLFEIQFENVFEVLFDVFFLT